MYVCMYVERERERERKRKRETGRQTCFIDYAIFISHIA